VVVQAFSEDYANPDAPLHWRQDGAVSGYNTLVLGMMIEVMQRWLGYATRVTAMDKFTYQTRPSADGKDQVQVDRPDSVYAIAELESGALASLMLSGVARHARDANRFEIYGTDGTIRYLAGSDTILAGKAGDPELKEVIVSPDEARAWT